MDYKKLSSSHQLIDYYFPVEETIFEGESKNNNLAEPINFSILKIENLGKCLVIQDDIQLIENGEEKYHEPFVHTPVSNLENLTSALVLGGGDGGICRELLKYKSLQNITLVEISPEIVESSIKYLPELGKSLEDEKVNIIYDNACDYIKKTKEKFDIIFIDATDFNSTEDLDSKKTNLRDTDNIKVCKNLLNQGGIVVYNDDYCGVSSINTLERVFALKKSYKYCKPFTAPIPYFFSGKYSFVMCSEDVDFDLTIIDWSEKNKIKTKFYDQKTHEASFSFDKEFHSLVKKRGISRKLGHLLTIDMVLNDNEILNDSEKINKIMENSCDFAGLKILNKNFFEFTPQGLTSVFILSESHLSCHTWPEYNRVCFDLFCCGDIEKIQKSLQYLVEKLKPQKYNTSFKERSV